MIPARYEATRFPFKLMQALGDKSIIRHTHDNTLATGLFDEVIVVTDSEIILNEIRNNGGRAVMSLRRHESGSDRIAEAAENIAADVILNVQGDEPFVNKPALKALLDAFNDPSVRVGSLMKKISDQELISDPNCVKVVVDKNMNSLLFSRSPIPYHRDRNIHPVYYEHIGVYGFRKETLMAFTGMQMTPLEQAEKIECLRYLENGIPLRMVITEEAGVKIDVPSDLEKAKKHLESLKRH